MIPRSRAGRDHHFAHTGAERIGRRIELRLHSPGGDSAPIKSAHSAVLMVRSMLFAAPRTPSTSVRKMSRSAGNAPAMDAAIWSALTL